MIHRAFFPLSHTDGRVGDYVEFDDLPKDSLKCGLGEAGDLTTNFLINAQFHPELYQQSGHDFASSPPSCQPLHHLIVPI